MAPQVDDILKELLNVEGSEGAVILSEKGDTLGASFKKEYDEKLLDENLSELLKLVAGVTSKESFGEPQQLFIQGGENQVLFYKISNQPYFAVIFGTSDMKTGFATISVEKVMHLFSSLK